MEALGAFMGPSMKLVTPAEVKRLQPQKATSWEHLETMLGTKKILLDIRATPETLDDKGDLSDSVIAGLAGYLKYQASETVIDDKETNERGF